VRKQIGGAWRAVNPGADRAFEKLERFIDLATLIFNV
jgi:hypothetical protein